MCFNYGVGGWDLINPVHTHELCTRTYVRHMRASARSQIHATMQASRELAAFGQHEHANILWRTIGGWGRYNKFGLPCGWIIGINRQRKRCAPQTKDHTLKNARLEKKKRKKGGEKRERARKKERERERKREKEKERERKRGREEGKKENHKNVSALETTCNGKEAHASRSIHQPSGHQSIARLKWE